MRSAGVREVTISSQGGKGDGGRRASRVLVPLTPRAAQPALRAVLPVVLALVAVAAARHGSLSPAEDTSMEFVQVLPSSSPAPAAPNATAPVFK